MISQSLLAVRVRHGEYFGDYCNYVWERKRLPPLAIQVQVQQALLLSPIIQYKARVPRVAYDWESALRCLGSIVYGVVRKMMRDESREMACESDVTR